MVTNKIHFYNTVHYKTVIKINLKYSHESLQEKMQHKKKQKHNNSAVG